MATVHIMGALAQKEHFSLGLGDEVWGLNGIRFAWLDGDDPRWTRFFNIHKYENLVRYGYQIGREVAWVKLHPEVKHYASDPWPELAGRRNHLIFPASEMAWMSRPNYHCGSFDWLLAFAVAEGFGEIVLHGVSLLAGGGEPISARACLEYWAGYAEGRGCTVKAQPDCDLFAFYHLVKSHMVYGYDDTPVYEDRTGATEDGEPPYKIPERA